MRSDDVGVNANACCDVVKPQCRGIVLSYYDYFYGYSDHGFDSIFVTLLVLISIGAWIALSIIAAYGASRRNRSFAGYLIMSLLLTPFFSFFVLVMLGEADEKKILHTGLSLNETINRKESFRGISYETIRSGESVTVSDGRKSFLFVPGDAVVQEGDNYVYGFTLQDKGRFLVTEASFTESSFASLLLKKEDVIEPGIIAVVSNTKPLQGIPKVLVCLERMATDVKL